MLAMQETFDKIQMLDEDNAAIVVDLVDYLCTRQARPLVDENNPFHKAWKEGSRNPMSEDEVDNFVSEVRRERNAGRG